MQAKKDRWEEEETRMVIAAAAAAAAAADGSAVSPLITARS